MKPRFRRWLLVVGIAAALGSCFAEGGALPPLGLGGVGGVDGSAASGGTAGATDAAVGTCVSPVAASEPLPARSSVLSATVQPLTREIFVDDIFARFFRLCGGCHVEASLGERPGGFRIRSLQALRREDAEESIARIRGNDPEVSGRQYMPPPPEPPFSQRPASDAASILANELEAWLKADQPPDVVSVPNQAGGSDNPYLLAVQVGEGLTNIGNCVPEPNFPFGRLTEKMDELDRFFAGLQRQVYDPLAPQPPEKILGLPLTLSETDLFTLDSEALARHGVIAFAPNYPLWSDGAGKLRHVRVPRGQPIRFDKQAQQFAIPPNTRFYKTFLKEVVDRDGKKRFRKLETRIIVSRPDVIKPDGSREPGALFGAYKWDSDETQATLVTASLRSGEPFQDDLFPIIIDEPAAEAVRAKKPLNLTYELEYEKLLRRYAIPSKERCVQCHMGSRSPTAGTTLGSFILGFTPLQIHRRPQGEGGTIEPSGEDELKQLERLIALGVISGITSPDEVVKLEDSQGDRKPRNDHELKAQGYMFGNCGHCHNPGGYPSVILPALKELLDFFPWQGGGIFQFPLERFSPRIFRGQFGEKQMPYITPSIRDLLPPEPEGTSPRKFYALDASLFEHVNAPWRSLLYRNVHTPFTYLDDSATFPHMPLHTPGYDCRAQRFIGDWMVSIPGRLKHPERDQNFVPTTNNIGEVETKLDTEFQPYVEIKPGEDGFERAKQLADLRIKDFRKYSEKYCPDTSDIVDPKVLRGGHLTPPDEKMLGIPLEAVLPSDGVPDRAHWVVTDLTERKGEWEPRRPDWPQVLIENKFPAPKAGEEQELEREKQVVQLLSGVTFTEALKHELSQPIPFALWQLKANCNFSTQRRLKEYVGDERLRWMDWPADEAEKALPPRDPEHPVYAALPGQAVYDMICGNCHGPNFDSLGTLALTVQNLTGGDTRVANFRFGLFGPDGRPGANRERVFGAARLAQLYPSGPPAGWTAPWPGSPDDWGMRYLGWMALGGTEKSIPDPALIEVANTKVVGLTRAGPLAPPGPNMLASAQRACSQVLLGADGQYDARNNLQNFSVDGPSGKTALIEQIADGALWLKICSLDNAPPVRGVRLLGTGRLQVTSLLYRREAFPSNAQVGFIGLGGRGRFETGLRPENLMPWCIIEQNDVDRNAYKNAEAQYLTCLTGSMPETCKPPPPRCPSALTPSTELTVEDQRAWTTRGALNAGFAVFVYLDKVMRGSWQAIGFNQCERLGGN